MLFYALNVLSTALALLLVDYIIPGVVIANFPAAIFAGIIIGIVNAVIRPILFLLSLPITILTLGFFALVVNGICLWLASLLTPGFTVYGFWGFILGPIVLSFVSTMINNFLISQTNRNTLDSAEN